MERENSFNPYDLGEMTNYLNKLELFSPSIGMFPKNPFSSSEMNYFFENNRADEDGVLKLNICGDPIILESK